MTGKLCFSAHNALTGPASGVTRMIRTKRFWVLLTLAVFLLGFAACSSAPEPESAEKAPEPEIEEPVKEPEPVETTKLDPPEPKAEPKVEPKPPKKVEPKPEPPKPPARPTVVIETSKGNIKVELNPERAPITVKNYLQYVDDKFYDGTIFHRVMQNFMIQGGGFTPDMNEKPNRPPIKLESGNGLANLRGAIAMARTNNPNSATSQLYINDKTNQFLDKSLRSPGYAVFGKVVEGLDVVDAIAAVPTGTHPKGLPNVPQEPIMIKSIRRAK